MLGRKLRDRYYIFNELGVGGFGQTFLAKDCDFPGQPWCVVKQFKPQVTEHWMLETARRLFDLEASVLAHIGNHPQIPELKAHFEENEQFYLVQEFIEGTLLSKEFESKRWDQWCAIAFLEDILGVIQFIHENEVIHRDLKPENLIRRQNDQRLVLIDFGSVKKITTLKNEESEASNFTVAIGTPSYMPLEQQGGKPCFSSDIYALGKITIQGLTGLDPNQLEDDENTGELSWQHLADVDDYFAQVLDRMVRWNPRDRYQTVQEVIHELQHYFHEMPSYPQHLVVNQAPTSEVTLETVVSNLKQHPEISRIKKLLFCACKQYWENSIEVLQQHPTQWLLQELYQQADNLDAIEQQLNQIVSTLSKPEKYQELANFVVEQVKPLYDNNAALEVSKNNNIPSKMTAVDGNKETQQYLVSENGDGEPNALEKPATPQTINLFDLRYEVIRYTTPLRIKILLFSMLYYKIGFGEQDWSMLKSYHLDDLLQQVIEMFSTLTELETRLYAIAKGFDQQQGLTQTVGAIVQSLRPFYEQGPPKVS